MRIDNVEEPTALNTSDDSEVDFSIRHEDSSLESSSNAPPGWNSEINLLSEVSSATLSNQNREEFCEGAFTKHVADVSLQYISELASPICFEKHYREYMIASIPQLRVLDNLPIRNIDREMANELSSKAVGVSSNSSLMVFGTLDGEVVVVNHENEKIVSYIPSLGAMNSVLGLCWLKKYPSKLIAGSDNGSLKLYDIQHFASTSKRIHTGAGSVTFDEFDLLTSVHVNSTDELFLASGYSKNVALYDINSGRRLQVFTDMHQEHINVVKFSNHSPSIFTTSSFDQDIKMWVLRQKPITPCYTASSSKGNVMVCFSLDDHYLLASAIDNGVRQLLAADGRLHLNFEIPSTGSLQNYTRSYYLNGKDYIISGSCDEHVVRVCCAQTGRRLRDVSGGTYVQFAQVLSSINVL
ncbi:hypothetical protein REPUB_Repub01dG0195300 [Reevesia pubescens]